MEEDYKALYKDAESRKLIERINETETAEKAFTEIINEIKALSPELAEKADVAAGVMARAYSIEGFRTGLNYEA